MAALMVGQMVDSLDDLMAVLSADCLVVMLDDLLAVGLVGVLVGLWVVSMADSSAALLAVSSAAW